MMNNIEKKLDALIDALGFDVEVSMTKKGRPYASFASSPAGVDVYKLDDDLYYECDSNYKLTKRDDVDLVKAMDRAIELMYAEFSWVDPEILAAFEAAGANR
jgi:hypothetical protein